ncbi:unnamed protein product [Aphanomyces euteiches]
MCSYRQGQIRDHSHANDDSRFENNKPANNNSIRDPNDYANTGYTIAYNFTRDNSDSNNNTATDPDCKLLSTANSNTNCNNNSLAYAYNILSAIAFTDHVVEPTINSKSAGSNATSVNFCPGNNPATDTNDNIRAVK